MGWRANALVIATLLSAPLGAEPITSAQLPSRPNIADYEDQSRFVTDVLAWEKLRAQLAEQPPQETPPESEDAEHDWHHVTGPENLDTALRNAEGYVQPNYKAKRRFNRTTHLSFPLQHLPADVMAHERADTPEETVSAYPLSELERLPKTVVDQLDLIQPLSPSSLPPAAPLAQNQ